MLSHLKYFQKTLPIFIYILKFVFHRLVLAILQFPLLFEENWAVVLLIHKLFFLQKIVEFWEKSIKRSSSRDLILLLNLYFNFFFLFVAVFSCKHDIFIKLYGSCSTRKILIRKLFFCQLLCTHQSQPSFTCVYFFISTFFILCYLRYLSPRIILCHYILPWSPTLLYLHSFLLDFKFKLFNRYRLKAQRIRIQMLQYQPNLMILQRIFMINLLLFP